MHRSEEHELVECVDCRATVSAKDRAYAITDETWLCFECAVRRGGVYDELHDHWTVEPRTSDEPDEGRAHP